MNYEWIKQAAFKDELEKIALSSQLLNKAVASAENKSMKLIKERKFLESIKPSYQALKFNLKLLKMKKKINNYV